MAAGGPAEAPRAAGRRGAGFSGSPPRNPGGARAGGADGNGPSPAGRRSRSPGNRAADVELPPEARGGGRRRSGSRGGSPVSGGFSPASGFSPVSSGFAASGFAASGFAASGFAASGFAAPGLAACAVCVSPDFTGGAERCPHCRRDVCRACMHREKIRLAGHMRRIRVCDQCAMVSTDPTAMLLQEDLDTHMDVSRTLYAAMNETDQDIASFKALLKMVVPSADDQMAIDDLLSRIADGVDDLVRESDAIEERLGSTGLATAELQSKLAQCESAMSSVVQRRHAIDAQVSMMPDIRAEGADLASQEELLTRKLHRLYARVEKLKPQAASVSLLPTKCDSLSDRPADESDPPCPSLLHLRDHRLPYLA